MNKCRKCGIEKESIYFHTKNTCKECNKKYHKEYSVKNREKKKWYMKEYLRIYLKTERGKEVAKKSSEKYRKSPKHKALIKRYTDEGKWKANWAKYSKTEKHIIRRAIYEKSEKRMISKRENLKKYKKTDKYKLYRKNKLINDPQFKLGCKLRTRLWDALHGKTRKGSAVKLLGCSLEELKIYIEGKFIYGMTWKNWSYKGWHIDHIKPLSSFDLQDEKQLAEACHYTNLQPLWAGPNMSKGSKYEKLK